LAQNRAAALRTLGFKTVVTLQDVSVRIATPTAQDPTAGEQTVLSGCKYLVLAYGL
jgi:hypothetical protein